jgi:predicted sugar kinase
LDALFLPESPPASPAELATATGRGRRSAIGTYGFHVGGLILEPGRRAGETIAPLEKRVPLPDAWRFVLLYSRKTTGLSGDAERAAFARLPPVPPESTRQLWRWANDVMFPAAAAGRFDEFADAVYNYGYLAGECFATVQGSAFAGPEIADLVGTLRGWGVRGVGQSSWGPTVFAVLPDAAAAEVLEARIRREYPPSELGIITTAPNNSGARIEIC